MKIVSPLLQVGLLFSSLLMPLMPVAATPLAYSVVDTLPALPNGGTFPIRSNLAARGGGHFAVATRVDRTIDNLILQEQGQPNVTLIPPVGVQNMSPPAVTWVGNELLVVVASNDGALCFRRAPGMDVERFTVFPSVFVNDCALVTMDSETALVVAPGLGRDRLHFGEVVDGAVADSFSIITPAGEILVSDPSVHRVSDTLVEVAVWTLIDTATDRNFTLRRMRVNLDPNGASAWEVVETAQTPVAGGYTTPVCGIGQLGNGNVVIGHMSPVASGSQIPGLQISEKDPVSGWDTDTEDMSTPNNQWVEFYIDELGRPSMAYRRNLYNLRTVHHDGSGWGGADEVSFFPGTLYAVARSRSGYLMTHTFEAAMNEALVHAPTDGTDLDGDGVPYLVEIALRTDPADGADFILPDFSLTDGEFPAFSFQTPLGVSRVGGSDTEFFNATGGYFLSIELSDDAEFWDPNTALVETDLFSITGRFAFIAAEQVNAVGTPGAKPFMRLRVVRDH